MIHDLIFALVFLAMVVAPAFIAMRAEDSGEDAPTPFVPATPAGEAFLLPESQR